MYIHGIHAIVC